MMEVFPVSVVHGAKDTRKDGKPCAESRSWYADWHDASRGGQQHAAQDIFAPRGSLVLAPERGKVTAAGETPTGGKVVKFRALSGRTYYFAHLDSLAVRAGDLIVSAGTRLGTVGATGNAKGTCPHLHLSARDKGERVNLYPELTLTDPMTVVRHRLRRTTKDRQWRASQRVSSAQTTCASTPT